MLLVSALFLALFVCVLGYLLIQNKTERERIQTLLQAQEMASQRQHAQFDRYQIDSLKLLQDTQERAVSSINQEVQSRLTQHAEFLEKRMHNLTQEVDKQLCKGFENTHTTFSDIVKRLTLIDQAQKKIADLSTQMTNLESVLNDKQARGALGEVQLHTIVRNLLPNKYFSLQHTLQSGKRVDCLLFLPAPTGNIAIDAKFPLENYRKIQALETSSIERKHYTQQFKNNIKKHIQDIAEKYISPPETADSAILFIPAESLFSDIHNNYPELVEKAHDSRVWLASPSTLMAILTTVKAVLKDAETRKQVHIIQEHLILLGKDFTRFQSRMDQLAKHIQQAQEDVSKIQTSSQKISNRFQKIEKVDLALEQEATLSD